MIRRTLLVALLAWPALAAAQQAEAPPPPPAKVFATVKVRLQTAAGPILLELEKERAPITTANFLRYVDQKKFDGATFYRALNFTGRPDLGLVQGGAKSDPKRLLPPIAHEPTTKTGLSHSDGAISMARGAPGSAQGDFFIILGGLPALDANPAAPGPEKGGDNQGFAVFGRVVEGMDVVKKILAAPVSATDGVGAMKGQMIEKPIPIQSARREP
jgi:peptidyl-prolyl cis-trans isomerase A (cyclophilin A)